MHDDSHEIAEHSPTASESASNLASIEGLAGILDLPIPNGIKTSLIAALSLGLFGVARKAFEIPIAMLDNVVGEIKARGQVKTAALNAAAEVLTDQIIGDPDLAARTLGRFGRELLTQQANRENVARSVINQFQSSPPPADTTQPVDPDWLTTFWNLAGSKSTAEVQDILAKVLKGELSQPGSVGPYTLQTLSVLTTDVGQAFARFCNLSIDDGETAYVIHPSVFAFQTVGPLDEYGIKFNDLLTLDGAGLIRSAEALRLNWGSDAPQADNDNPSKKYEIVDYAGQQAQLSLPGHQLNHIYLTKAGQELRKLIPLVPHLGYTTQLKLLLGDDFVPAQS